MIAEITIATIFSNIKGYLVFFFMVYKIYDGLKLLESFKFRVKSGA